ncbi:hypothetical protein CCACVL1_07698 [Corchorus capsularis]|uniref:BHLH domain-containing protein n=1 Tax=Corchorus capsularis TaxID=210143 RepID=A0A1R3J4E2_COCAP|nr:hypothetical protein CCACVL1_07698 [Corchorus capsularis]
MISLIPNSSDHQDAINVLISNISHIRNDSRQLRRKAAIAFGVNDIDDGKLNNNKRKKIIHRDIERQRRQEMAKLYETLRSLLPVEYLKGKRSLPDHMNEAVNYIKHLQKKMLKLSEKRDELKKLSSNSYGSSSSALEISQDSNSKGSSIMVRPCLAGVEVVISTSFQLSSVLQLIVAEGLSVLTCISTKVNTERLIHTIVSEVNDGRSIELCELQQKLRNISPFI